MQTVSLYFINSLGLLNIGNVIFIFCHFKVKQDRREKWPWPAEYTYFVVHKENIDTMKAALVLSQNLKCRPNNLTYAGTKDKRAKTSQLFCIRKRHPETIVQAASRVPNVFVGNFEFREHTLRLGQLKGNRFRIALRNVTAPDEIVKASMKTLEEFGFINYYGLQRFGRCPTVPTSTVGKALLKGQFDVACELILKPRDNEPDFMKKMRDFWWKTRDAKAALGMLRPTNQCIESRLLAGLAQHGKNDFVSALGNIPRNMRLLYIHAYQSLVFNRVASRRIKEWGVEVHEGDLVFVDRQKTEMIDNVAALNVDADIHDLLVELEADTVSDDQEEDTVKATEDEEEEVSVFKGLARPLTKEDISTGQYTIHDVVLPLPGHDIYYPSNETADWYNEFLAEDGLSSEKLKQKVKVYSLAGAYRKLLVRPEELSWSIVRYTQPNDELIVSDLDALRAVKKSTHMKFDDVDQTKSNDSKNQYRAIVVEFNLPSSCYATMALREILKIDTSTSSQMKLNHKNNKNELMAVAAAVDDVDAKITQSTVKKIFDENIVDGADGTSSGAEVMTSTKCEKREFKLVVDADGIAEEGGDEKRPKVE